MTADLQTNSFGPTELEESKRAAAQGRCHSCNREEILEWRRGPDGPRRLCNACSLHYAKFTRNHKEEARRYGRHGDIMAENILWFEENDNPHGLLVVADSGLMAFHSADTRSNVHAKHVTGLPSSLKHVHGDRRNPEVFLHQLQGVFLKERSVKQMIFQTLLSHGNIERRMSLRRQ